MNQLATFLLCASIGTLGVIGGIGGATILVPVLLLLGEDPHHAAALGLISIGTGSLAATPRQVASGVVHQRLGVVIELTVAVGVGLGILASRRISGNFLSAIIAVIALASAIAVLRRPAPSNPTQGLILDAEDPGEFPGTLAGQYRTEDGVAHYQAANVPVGSASLMLAGVISGLSGVGGGFIKVPVLTNVMKIPAHVAAATSTYTIGITATTGLLALGIAEVAHDHAVPAVVLGALLGGRLGVLLGETISLRAGQLLTAVLLTTTSIAVVLRIW